MREVFQVITPDGETKDVPPKDGKEYTLKELQKIVDGFIEFVYLGSDYIMVVNESGLIDNRPVNPVGTLTAYLYKAISKKDRIHGTVLICNRKFIS